MIDYYDYIVSHWQDYNLTDTKEDFLHLINILEAMQESIDTLHHAVLNGYDFLGCYYIADATCDRDVVETLFYFNKFLTVEDLKEFLYASIEYDGMELTKEFYCDNDYSDDYITRTTDGYVHTIAV